jgi:Protein of unknown function (DUF2752)
MGVQIARRHLAPNEFDHEFVWLIVSLVSLGVAALWLGLGLPWPRCVFHDLTGLPCLTCGATRSAAAFFHGRIFTAFKWNPLVFVILCALSVFNIYAATTLIFRVPRLRIGPFNRAEAMFARSAFLVVLLGNWIYLLINWRAF